MAPFEALYGRRCRTPLYWAEVGEQTLIGPELLQEMEDTVGKVRDRMKRAQDRYTKYANNRRRPLEFTVGDFAYLKVSPMLGVKRFGMQSKLSPRYVGPFEITERIGEVAYRLKLTDALTGVHDVFHVSQLRKCIRRPDQVIEAEPLMIQPDLTYEERPIRIEDRKDKVLRNKVIPLVKVIWQHHGSEDATWELETEMRAKYPYLFTPM